MSLLKSQGFTLSIDTLDPGEIVAADRAGVDYVLSLNGQNLDVAARIRATPVLIPDSRRSWTPSTGASRTSSRSDAPTSSTR